MRSSKGATKVRTARRSTGGVAMIDNSRTPDSASCRVRGIGVADSVSTWTAARNSLSFSLWPTPKCCSSSMTTRPRFLKRHLLAEHGMGADDDIHRTIRRARARRAHVGGGGHARHLREPDRQAGETRGEILDNAGGRAAWSAPPPRPANAVDRRRESRAQGHFGLAEADVAANQPVHRLARGHVAKRRLDGAKAGRRSRHRGSGRRIPRRAPRAG